MYEVDTILDYMTWANEIITNQKYLIKTKTYSYEKSKLIWITF